MSALGHLMWKEYRVLRSFWLALAISGVAIQGLTMLLVESAPDRLTTLIVLAQTMVACFALGAGATQFAVEREEATYDFLRCLPVTSGQIFTCKALLTLIGTFLLGATLIGSAAGYTAASGANRWELDHSPGAVQLAIAYVMVVLQAMGWGTFFSLRSARPLLAAFLGAVGALCWMGLAQLVAARFKLTRPDQPWGLPLVWAAATAIVWIADAWLGVRWLHRRRCATRIESRRATPMGNLLWQQWRTSYRLLAVLVALGLLVPGLIWPAFIPTTGLVITLVGCCTFLADQEGRQFRFFVEHGVAARRLWISRQWFWAGAALSLAVVLFAVHRLIGAVLTAMPPDAEARYLFTHLRWVFDPFGYAAWIGLAFGAGQLCSMFFRSGVLAAALGVVLASLLLCWAVLMHLLAIAFWWSVAPLIVAMFAATWLRTNGWMLERNSGRARLPPLLALAVPTLSILAAVPVYRVWEIPDLHVELTIPVQSPPSADAKEAARSFMLACERLPLRTAQNGFVQLADPVKAVATPDKLPWLKENEVKFNEALSELAKLPTDATIQGSSPRTGVNWWEIWSEFRWMAIRSGQIAELDGELDDAWRRYQAVLKLAKFLRHGNGAIGEIEGEVVERSALVQLPRWGVQQGQTVERLRAALAEVSQIGRQDEPLADVVRQDYADNLEVLNTRQARPEEWGRTAVLLARFAPWEFARARRLLKYNASLLLDAAQHVDMGLSWQASRDMTNSLRRVAELGRWSETTWPNCEMGDLTFNRRWALCHRGGTQLALAAEAYRLEQGQLPLDLAELQDKYLDKLPVDPFNNSQFVWFPWGLRSAVRLQNVARLPGGTPFVYTPGPANVDNELWIRIDRLRRRSADDPLVYREESSLPGGPATPAAGLATPFAGSMMGMPGAGGPAGTVPAAPSPEAPAAAAIPAGLSAADEPTESLPGLAFPIPTQ